MACDVFHKKSLALVAALLLGIPAFELVFSIHFTNLLFAVFGRTELMSPPAFVGGFFISIASTFDTFALPFAIVGYCPHITISIYMGNSTL